MQWNKVFIGLGLLACLNFFTSSVAHAEGFCDICDGISATGGQDLWDFGFNISEIITYNPPVIPLQSECGCGSAYGNVLGMGGFGGYGLSGGLSNWGLLGLGSGSLSGYGSFPLGTGFGVGSGWGGGSLLGGGFGTGFNSGVFGSPLLLGGGLFGSYSSTLNPYQFPFFIGAGLNFGGSSMGYTFPSPMPFPYTYPFSPITTNFPIPGLPPTSQSLPPYSYTQPVSTFPPIPPPPPVLGCNGTTVPCSGNTIQYQWPGIPMVTPGNLPVNQITIPRTGPITIPPVHGPGSSGSTGGMGGGTGGTGGGTPGTIQTLPGDIPPVRITVPRGGGN